MRKVISPALKDRNIFFSAQLRVKTIWREMTKFMQMPDES